MIHSYKCSNLNYKKKFYITTQFYKSIINLCFCGKINKIMTEFDLLMSDEVSAMFTLASTGVRFIRAFLPDCYA